MIYYIKTLEPLVVGETCLQFEIGLLHGKRIHRNILCRYLPLGTSDKNSETDIMSNLNLCNIARTNSKHNQEKTQREIHVVSEGSVTSNKVASDRNRTEHHLR